MKPLIDGDVLRYEIGSIGENAEEGIKDFDFVAAVLDGRIYDICDAVGATEPPTVYLTGKDNFRDKIAVSKPYKGTRKDWKPWHFNNITVYMLNRYDTVVVEGMEADDAMAIEQCRYENTIICTRDKDLRQVPGWHYGWECGKQREFGPRYTDAVGSLALTYSGKTPKLVGTGNLFFYSQLLTGDTVDNIPGLPKCGPVKAYEILEDARKNNIHPLEAVELAYRREGYGRDYLLEQGQLLWMIRELDDEGNPVLWQIDSTAMM